MTEKEKDLFFTQENADFVNAFIKVGKILDPNVTFVKVTYTKQLHEGGMNVSYLAVGTDNLHQVEMSVEDDPKKGKQIVVRYFNPNNYVLIKERKLWFYSFNWKGLMVEARSEIK